MGIDRSVILNVIIRQSLIEYYELLRTKQKSHEVVLTEDNFNDLFSLIKIRLDRNMPVVNKFD